MNRLINQKINQLTNATSAILKVTKSSEEIVNQKANILKNKIQLIKDEITNIIYSITWAKSNTINFFVFTSTETTVVEDIFKKKRLIF